MTRDALTLVRACLDAYVNKDRAAIESLLADDYRFTSPLDNAIDRATYFARCWPGSATFSGFDFICGAQDGDRAYITYEAQTAGGKRFRNSELHTVRDGQLVSTEVYFGWNLPHDAPKGGFTEK